MFMTTIIYILENIFGHLQNIIKELNYQHELTNNHLKKQHMSTV
jgi:hypothetical protein